MTIMVCPGFGEGGGEGGQNGCHKRSSDCLLACILFVFVVHGGAAHLSDQLARIVVV